jgi:hypothetical protein
VTLQIRETRCHYDLCYGTAGGGPSGSWTVADTSIVTFALTSAGPAPLTAEARGTTGIITAQHAGRTTLRVKLPVPVRENIGNADPANTTIELPIVVVP